MTDLRQAAQQALEALETCGEDEWHSEDDFGMVQTYDEDKVAKAITALRTALAMREVSEFAQAQEQAEPVAWMVYTQDGQSVYVTDNPTDIQEGQRALPLYTTPPQRQWVGLEAEDLAQIENDEFWQTGNHMAIAVAVEAKLKERNT